MFYNISDISKITQIPYSTLRRWVLAHNVSATTSVSGKKLVSEEGLEQIRSMAAYYEKIKELQKIRFGRH